MEKAYLVPTFHHDIAYLRPEAEYTPACFRILDEALYILENNPEYRFFMEQAWLLEEYWDARPEKRESMRRFASEGRFVIEPGLYAVPDMNLPDGESLYMHAYIGKKIAASTLGTVPRVCMIADCWGHHAQIPQILSDCGYDYYAFSRCMRTDADRQNFVWRGVDGSRIKAHWMSTHYDGIGFPSEAEQINAAELSWAEGAEGIKRLIEQNRVKCGDAPQYLPVGGDMRFPSRLAPAIVKKLNARGDLPLLEFSTPGNALDAIDWENQPEFGGEFESSMQGTFTTNIIIKQLDRQYAGELYAIEAMAAVMGSRAEFEEAWKLHLKNQFHDIACGTICNRALKDVEADFRALGIMLTAQRRKLSGGSGEKKYFNSLPFERNATVDEGVITLAPLAFTSAISAVKPRLIETALPMTFENRWYSAEIGCDGYISALTDRATGAQLVNPGSPAKFGSLVMQMDYGDSWWEFEAPYLTRTTQAYTLNRPDPLVSSTRRSFFPDSVTAEVAYADEDRVVIKQTCLISFWVTEIEYVTTITLSKSDRLIRYNTSFTNKSKDFRLRAAFPTNGLTQAFRQIPYALVPFGDGIQACQRFACLTDGSARLAVINRGTPAYSVDGDVLMLSLFRAAAMEYKCDSSDSYAIGRKLSFDYAVACGSNDDDESLWNAALDFNTPVQAIAGDVTARGISVKGAQVSAIRQTEEGLFVRIYNPTGREVKSSVSVEGSAGAYLTDGLMNRYGEAISGTEIALPPYHVQGMMFV